ncbi:MAG: HAMP domain-containing histidine kinase, partial [Rhodocyclaceae bacterium]
MGANTADGIFGGSGLEPRDGGEVGLGVGHQHVLGLGAVDQVAKAPTGCGLVGVATAQALGDGAEGEPVQVSLSSEGVLTVANEGPVAPSEVLSRLMDRFERAGRHTDGSGLGLAIVHAVAQRIG